jgi:DNA repair protein RadA/Sms
MDAYFKVTGGVSIDDPALDVGIMAAAVSSLRGRAIPPQWAVCGEVGLTGEIRRVPRIDERVKEAGGLGFTRIVVPGSISTAPVGVLTYAVSRISDVVSRLGLESPED